MTPVSRLFPCGFVLMFVLAGSAQLAAAAPQDGRGPAAADPGKPAGDPSEPVDPAGESAAESAIEEQQADIEELERRIEVLAEEIERMRSGEEQVEVSVDEARALGLAPSAAATYGIERGVSIAGYGEMLYESYASDKTAQFDYLRAILYAGYRFNDKFIFNSEIEVEHAKEIFVEFAYVDYLAHENFGVRAGMLLVPMGLVNEFHEPTVFNGRRASGDRAEHHPVDLAGERRGSLRLGRRHRFVPRLRRERLQRHGLLVERPCAAGGRRAARRRRTTWRSPAA